MRPSRVGPLASVFTLVHAVPHLIRRTETPLSASQLAGLAPYTQFARAAYCSTSSLSNWSCGRTLLAFQYLHHLIDTEACAALPGFQPTLVGGDGNAVQVCMYLPRLTR